MFNFLKRKKRNFDLFSKRNKKITQSDIDFFKAIVEKLPGKYAYLKCQVNFDFILEIAPNPLAENCYTLILNPVLAEKFKKEELSYLFIIQNIQVYNKRENKWESVDFHIHEGLLVGYQLKSPITDIDIETINCSAIKEKHFNNVVKDQLKAILSAVPKEYLNNLDIDDTFEIDIPEGRFYTIKDLGDGNYLSIRDTGAIYLMVHDPYIVKKLFNTKEEFFSAITAGTFNIEDVVDKYLN